MTTFQDITPDPTLQVLGLNLGAQGNIQRLGDSTRGMWQPAAVSVSVLVDQVTSPFIALKWTSWKVGFHFLLTSHKKGMGKMHQADEIQYPDKEMNLVPV